MRHSKRAVVAVAAVALAVALTQPASGHRKHGFGGLWTHTRGDHLYLPYAFGGAAYIPLYGEIINKAMLAWYDTDTHVWPYSVSSGNVVYFDVDTSGESFWGYTLNYQGQQECSTYGCRYSFAYVFLNRSELDAETQAGKQKVVVHEFGHVLGLSHPCANGRCPRTVRAIMNQGRLPYSRPQNHDVNDVNGMYP